MLFGGDVGVKLKDHTIILLCLYTAYLNQFCPKSVVPTNRRPRISVFSGLGQSGVILEKWEVIT